MRSILVCDDEEVIRLALCDHLTADGYDVVAAADGDEALAEIDARHPDALLLDVRMPGLDGLGVLRRLRDSAHDDDTRPAVIMMTAHAAVDTVVEATKLGASTFLSKPFDFHDVTSKVSGVLRHRAQRLDGVASYGALVGQSTVMRAVFALLRRLETVEAPTVLLTGETGTGKDLVAREIHARGPRHKQPFVAIDCAAIPAALLESELFGHERGSFTDAYQQKRGLFEIARGGTIFLDEIGEMPPAMQAKLLRALESRSFRRVGGTTQLPLDAGVISATSRELRGEVEAGRFRADLFFRLNVVPIELPPLRRRRGDIEPLARTMLQNLGLRREVTGIDDDALAILQQYPWPGNVRELRNILERSVILKTEGDLVAAADLPLEIRQTSAVTAGEHVMELPEHGVRLADLERDLIMQAMRRAGGNKTRAAQLLGITRFALRNRLAKRGKPDS